MTLKRSDITFPVTLYYDGACPLCQQQINWLNTKNKHQRLKTVNIHQEGFSEQYPELDRQALNQLIHARLGNGQIVTGMDAVLAAWEAIGRGWLIVPLRWCIIRKLTDHTYQLLAQHRYAIAQKLTLLSGRLPQCSKKQPPSHD